MEQPSKQWQPGEGHELEAELETTSSSAPAPAAGSAGADWLPSSGSWPQAGLTTTATPELARTPARVGPVEDGAIPWLPPSLGAKVPWADLGPPPSVGPLLADLFEEGSEVGECSDSEAYEADFFGEELVEEEKEDLAATIVSMQIAIQTLELQLAVVDTKAELLAESLMLAESRLGRREPWLDLQADEEVLEWEVVEQPGLVGQLKTQVVDLALHPIEHFDWQRSGEPKKEPNKEKKIGEQTGKQLQGPGADTAVATKMGKLVSSPEARAAVGCRKDCGGRFGAASAEATKKLGGQVVLPADTAEATKMGKLVAKKLGLQGGRPVADPAVKTKMGKQNGAAVAEAGKMGLSARPLAGAAEKKMGKLEWQAADSAEGHRRKMLGLLLGPKSEVAWKPLESELEKKAAEVVTEAAKKAAVEAMRLEKEAPMAAGPEALLEFLRGHDFGDLGRDTVELIVSLMLVK